MGFVQRMTVVQRQMAPWVVRIVDGFDTGVSRNKIVVVDVWQNFVVTEDVVQKLRDGGLVARLTGCTLCTFVGWVKSLQASCIMHPR